MIRRPPRSTRVRSSAASDVYKRQEGSWISPAWIAAVAIFRCRSEFITFSLRVRQHRGRRAWTFGPFDEPQYSWAGFAESGTSSPAPPLDPPMTSSPSSETTADIGIFDPDGGATTLGAFQADRLIVILVRYFGCLPCQEYVRDLDRRFGRFPNGNRMIAVGGSADYQARWLRDIKGVAMPLLLDPDQRVRAVADVGDLTARQMSRFRGAGNYLRSGSYTHLRDHE